MNGCKTQITNLLNNIYFLTATEEHFLGSWVLNQIYLIELSVSLDPIKYIINLMGLNPFKHIWNYVLRILDPTHKHWTISAGTALCVLNCITLLKEKQTMWIRQFWDNGIIIQTIKPQVFKIVSEAFLWGVNI